MWSDEEKGGVFNLRWLKRKKEPEAVPAEAQLRGGEIHPFGILRDYVPLQSGEARLYRAVREAVPVVDAAIYKLIRMTRYSLASPLCKGT